MATKRFKYTKLYDGTIDLTSYPHPNNTGDSVMWNLEQVELERLHKTIKSALRSINKDKAKNKPEKDNNYFDDQEDYRMSQY